MGPKLKGIIIIFIIGLALLPAWICIKWLEKKIRPRESGTRFFGYLVLMFLLVFVFSFLLVFGIRLLFPGA